MSRRSKCRVLAAVLSGLVFATAAPAATPTETLKPGTVLPVQLRTSLNTRKTHPGQLVRADIMQDIPGTAIRKGARVFGSVVNVTPEIPGHPASLTLRFHTLQTKAGRLLIDTSLRAFASFMDIHEAQIPFFGPDRGTPQYWWTTRQIGGQVVYGWDGPVGGEPAAISTPDGIVTRMLPGRQGGCGEDATNEHVQALWLFSADACGLYGFGKVALQHTGRTEPVGLITLVAPPGKNLTVQSGSGLLLQVLTTGGLGQMQSQAAGPSLPH